VSQDRFRYDYCGQLAALDNAVIFWSIVDELDDGTDVFLPAVYCGAYCGRTATSRTASGRG